MGYVPPPVARKSMVPESNDIIPADSAKMAERPQTSPRTEDTAIVEPISRQDAPLPGNDAPGPHSDAGTGEHRSADARDSTNVESEQPKAIEPSAASHEKEHADAVDGDASTGDEEHSPEP